MNEPTTALIRRDDARLRVEYTEAANSLRQAALERSALVARVSTPEEQSVAVEAQIALKSILSESEKARKACKDPVLEFGKRIDDAAKRFKEPIDEEMMRISKLVADYQQLEQAKARAAAQAQAEEASRIEREKAAALAQAKSHEEADAIQEHFGNKAALLAQETIAPARTDGQRITNDWNITVQDIHLLYRMHPNCVELRPRISEIKNLLKLGVTPRGVLATPIVIATVRVGGAKLKAIDV